MEVDVSERYSESGLLQNGNDDEINDFLTQLATVESIDVAKFIVVAENIGKPKSEHSVGQIIAEEDEEIKISYLVKSNNFFYWPDPTREFWEKTCNVHLVLDTPEMNRREHFTFSDGDMKKNKSCCDV